MWKLLAEFRKKLATETRNSITGWESYKTEKSHGYGESYFAMKKKKNELWLTLRTENWLILSDVLIA
ncbi:hypothetical protein WUBG_12150 [Wuchereria bancrofti]|uniref:Uncharacterized protein n=1 Tax=Wuchereria bancrofti TaxID=6293 RepID=J9E450_WUCBA|nr:hypothetical protein WUBG_12150 [Wuchereria bancrofti]